MNPISRYCFAFRLALRAELSCDRPLSVGQRHWPVAVRFPGDQSRVAIDNQHLFGRVSNPHSTMGY